MSMRELAIAGAIALAGLPALAEDTPAADTPRAFAAAVVPLPDTGEPTPPSPVIAGGAETSPTPGLERDFGIGRPATGDEIAAIDIDVMPDGTGLMEGSGTYATGEALFAAKCSACHGEALEGVKATGGPRLIGGRDTLATAKPVKTVESYGPYASTLIDYVHRAMPMDAPGSLTADEVYAVSAFILGQAGILGKDVTLDAESFGKIVMPNADGFIPDPRPGTR